MNSIYVPMGMLYEENGTRVGKEFNYNNFVFDVFNLILTDTDGFKKEVRVEMIKTSKQYPIMHFGFYIQGEYSVFSISPKDNERGYNIYYVDGANKISEKQRQEVATDIASLILTSIFVIMTKGIERCRQWRVARPNNVKYSREHRISITKNKIYLFSDIVNYVAENYTAQGIHHEIQCPCWEVRGHYRHYKSGKVVFIPSYKKGKDKDKAKPLSHEYYVERSKQ